MRPVTRLIPAGPATHRCAAHRFRRSYADAVTVSVVVVTGAAGLRVSLQPQVGRIKGHAFSWDGCHAGLAAGDEPFVPIHLVGERGKQHAD